jgi:hypothetical protein
MAEEITVRLGLKVPHLRIRLYFKWLRVKAAFGFPIDIEREAERMASWCKTTIE